MSKIDAQYGDLKKALKRLKEAAHLPAGNSINQDATIQRFEFTFELSWKLMQTIVNENMKEVYGPKNIIREAAKLHLISHPSDWFEFLENRNLTVHTYRQEVAKKVYASAKKFIPHVEELLIQVKTYVKN